MDILFDGAGRDERMDENGVVLTDAVGAVACLVFHGGVPPAVEMDDMVGAGEGETGSGSAQRKQEEGWTARRLELLHEPLAFINGSFPVQHESRRTENALQKIVQMRHDTAVLREDEAAFSRIAYLFCQVSETLKFAGK